LFKQYFVLGAQMKFTRVVAIAVIVGSVGIGALQAQSFRDQPKEFPPATYKGKQYVDSTGCVFIRAGIDGNVTWVPRVSRKRDGVCGFKPTNVGTAAASPASTAGAPVQITLDNAPKQTTRVAAAPAAAAKPRPVPQVRRAQPVVRQTAPKVVRQAAPRPVAPAPKVVASASVAAPRVAVVCPGRSALSQRYTGTAGDNVRCGPQAHRIVGVQGHTPRGVAPQYKPQSRTGTVAVAPRTRIVPKHVAINRINTFNSVQVPNGYKQVWEDDRLNPKRAEQNLAGRTQMLLIWTNTVPRRLINQTTGQDVTAKMPLIYPYTSIDQQRREMGEVTLATRDGQLVKRIVRNPGGAPVLRKPTYSSRSAAKPDAVASVKPVQIQNGGSTYVQVGTFKNASNAQQTAQRIARMGMGARIGKSIRGGKTYLSVQAGPFPKTSASKALGKLRGVGYQDAYIR
jgi:cell division protein FtsN